MQNSIILEQIDLQQLEALISIAVNKGIALQVSQPTNTATNQNELLTRKEVCEMLHITLPTLHNWSKENFITSYRINTRVRYKRAEVMETLQKVSQLKYRRAV
jgi:excisionase family DNA binding protein